MDLTSLQPSLHPGILETKPAGTCPTDIPPIRGSVCFPTSLPQRDRDLTAAKALLFLSTFRNKTKRQGRGGGEASPCISLWARHSSTQRAVATAGTHLPTLPQLSTHSGSRMDHHLPPLLSPMELGWGGESQGLTYHNFDFSKNPSLIQNEFLFLAWVNCSKK